MENVSATVNLISWHPYRIRYKGDPHPEFPTYSLGRSEEEAKRFFQEANGPVEIESVEKQF